MKDFLPGLRSLVIRVGTIGLLLGLPLVLLIFGLEQGFERECIALQGENARVLESLVSRYTDSKLHISVFSETFHGIMEKGKRLTRPETFWDQEFRKLKRDFPETFETVMFDEKGRVIAEYSDLPEYHHLLNQFGPEYVQFQTYGSPALNEHLEQYRGFLGPFITDLRVSRSQRWTGYQNLVSLTRRRAILICPGGEIGKPWFAAWISLPQDGPDLIFRFALKQWSPWGCTHAILDLDAPAEEFRKCFGRRLAPLVPRALGALGTHTGKAVFSDGFQWIQVRISDRKRWVAASFDSAQKAFETSCRRLRLFAFGFLFSGFFLWEILRNRVSISLRVKLVFLSLYISGTPLFLLFLSAQGLFQERRQVMEKRIHLVHEETIREFNRRFLDYLGWIEEVAKRLKGPPLPDGEAGRQAAIRALMNIKKLVSPYHCELFDEKGGSLFHFARSRSDLFQKVAPFFGIQVARSCAEQNRTDLSLQENTREQAFKASMESIGFDLDEIGSMLLCSPNSMVNARIGEDEINALNLGFYDRRNHLKYCAILGWGLEVIDDFLMKRLEGFQKHLPDITIGTWLSWGPKNFPPSFAMRECMNDIFQLLWRQAMPIHTQVTLNGKRYLLTGVLGKELNRCFLAYSTDEKVVAEIRKTAIRLGGIGIFLMVMGLGIGLLVSRSFLRPVELLSEGMMAMQNRDFSARVAVLSEDEFGTLSQTFNLLMENLADLEVAKIVQDTFFPQESLKRCGWEIYGTSVSASRVGGDYFDYFPLSDGRWLFLIGDVSGHGVPAALVVAMAKALVFHPANPTVPSKILGILNLQLARTLGGKRLMTCFLGVFEPETGALVVSNAGHNYPFLVQGKEAKEVKIQSSPLGTKAKRPYQDHCSILGEGQSLVFYTDGLIEALDEKGEAVGYDRFACSLPGLIGPEAAATERSIRSWFGKTAKAGPLADDLTLMVLQRSGGFQ